MSIKTIYLHWLKLNIPPFIKLIIFIWWFLYAVCHCRDKLLARNGYIARVCWQMLVSFFLFFPFCYLQWKLLYATIVVVKFFFIFVYLSWFLSVEDFNSCINLAGVFVLHNNQSFLLHKLFPCTLMCKPFSQLCHQDRFCSYLVLQKRKVACYHSFK